MKRYKHTIVIYEHLEELLQHYIEENNHSSISEAVRTILEDHLGASDEERQAYRDSVISGRMKGNTSPKRKRGRKMVMRKLRKAMRKNVSYTLRELAELTGFTRQIIKEVVEERYPEYFKANRDEKGHYAIKKASIKDVEKVRREKDELTQKQHREIELQEKYYAEYYRDRKRREEQGLDQIDFYEWLSEEKGIENQ